MIKVGSKLFVADNTGAKEVKCIKVLKSSGGGFASISDLIVVSVKKSISSKKIKQGNVLYAIVVRTIRNIKRIDGTHLKFSENSVVLLDKEKQMLGTRIFGPIPKEIKYSDCSKIVSLAQEVV